MRRKRSHLSSAFASLAACLMLAAVSLQTPPPAAAAQQPVNPVQDVRGPSTASLSRKPAPTEVPSLRTTYSNTYDNHDGTYTAQVSAGPVNYLPAGTKTYQPIDTKFAAMSGKGGRVRAGHMANPVEIGAPDDASGFVSMDTGQGVIRMSLAAGVKPGKAGSKPSTKGSVADVAGVMPNIDLRASVDGVGVRTYFILNSRPSSSSFSLSLDAGGLTPSLQADGSISFLDKKGAAAAYMPAPYATDSAYDPNVGSGKTTYDVSYSLAKSGKQWVLTVSVDPTWLANATYPVNVDPSVSGTTYVWNNTVNNQSGLINTVKRDMVTTDSPPYHEFLVGYDGNSQWASYLKYDLAAAGVPAATIVSNNLHLWPYHQWYTTGEQTSIAQVTTNWSNTTLTWNNAPFKSNLYPAALMTFISSTGAEPAVSLPLSLVQGWDNGSISNYGIYLYAAKASDTHYWKRFIDAQDTAHGHNPYLEVTFAVPVAAASSPTGGQWVLPGTSMQWTYTQPGIAQTKSQVQIATDSGFASVVYDSGAQANTNHSWPIPSLSDTGYYWRVKVYDGYGWSGWTAGSLFGYDGHAPTWVGFGTPPKTVVSTDTFDFAWSTASDSGSGVSGYRYQLNYSALSATPNTCSVDPATGGTSVVTGTTTALHYPAPISTRGDGCYKLLVLPVDVAGNVGVATSANWSPYTVIRDSSAPDAPVITVTGAGSYKADAHTVFFGGSASSGTIQITATSADAQTGVTSIAATDPSPAIGWSASTSGSGASLVDTLNWTSAAGTSGVTFTATNGSALTSANAVSLTKDVTAPTVGFTYPANNGHPHFQSGATYQLKWSEADSSGSQVASRSVVRQKAALDPNHVGTCTAFTTDRTMTAVVTNGQAVLDNSDLVNGYCYDWVVTITDNVGNTATYTSDWVMRDAAVPASPTVDATGPGTYQNGPNGKIYVDGRAVGTLTVTSTGSSGTSGIASSGFAFADTQDPTGWSGVPIVVTDNPAAAGIGWSTSASSPRTLQVTTTTSAGVTSAPTTMTVEVDTLAPSADLQSLDHAAINLGQTTSSWTLNATSYRPFQIGWTASDSGSGVKSTTVKRQVATVIHGNSGGVPTETCSGAVWQDDASWTPDGPSTANNNDLADGKCYRWILTAKDNLLHSQDTVSGSILVDITAPFAGLSVISPQAGQPVAGTVTIKGTATDDEFGSYKLEYGTGTAPSSWTTIFVGSAPVTASTLANWATGSMSGVYTVRMIVVDTAGNGTTITTTVYVDNADRGGDAYNTSAPFDLGGGWSAGVNVATGEASIARSLFSIGGYGPAQSLSLTYNSNDGRANDPLGSSFGPGWSSNITQYLDVTARAQGFVVWHRADGAEVPFGIVNGSFLVAEGHYEQLADLGSSGYKITYVDRSSVTFDAAGKLAAIVDGYGKSLSVSWGTSSATVTDAVGRHMSISFSGAQISSVTDSAGRSWAFTYPAGKLLVKDPENNTTEFDYGTSSARIEAIVRTLTALNADGSKTSATNRWAIAYNGSNQVQSVTSPIDAAAGKMTSFAYAGGAYVSTQTIVTQPGDATYATPGLATTYNLNPNARGWVDSIVTPVRQGVPAADINLTTSFRYDDNSGTGNGNVTQKIRQIDATHTQTTGWTYDPATGKIASQTDQLTATTNVVTTNTYGSNGNLLETTVKGSPTADMVLITAYAYDQAGHVTCKIFNPSSSIANLSTIDCGFDASLNYHSNLTLATGEDSSVTNVVTAYAYDANSLLVESVDVLGTVTRFTYHADGTPESTIRNYTSGTVAVDTNNLTTTYVYDAAGNMLSETDPVTSQTPAVTSTTTYTYNRLGSMLTKASPGDSWAPGGEQVFTYDEFGSPTSETSCTLASPKDDCATGFLGTSIRTRDILDRPVVLADITPAHDSVVATTLKAYTTYDSAGNSVSQTSKDGVQTTWTFDSLSRVLTESSLGSTVSHAYDGLADYLQTVTTTASSTSTTIGTFHPSGKPATATTDTQLQLTYSYDTIGRLVGAIDATGLHVSSSTYDKLGRTLSATITNKVTALDGSSSNVTSTVETTYDAAGHVLTSTAPYQAGQTKLTTSHVYDALGRVKSTTDPTGLTTTSHYDAAGDEVATVAPDNSVARRIYDVHGSLAETIANCSDNDTAPTGSPATSACVGAATGGWNVRTISTTVVGAGKITSTTTSGTVTTTTTTDGAGRVIQTIVDPNGAHLATDYTYDSKGRQVSQTTPAPSGSGKVVTVTEYDAASGKVSRTISNCTDAALNPAWSNCATVNDGTHDLVTSYLYDGAGNVTRKQSPSGAYVTYTYDSAGRVTSMTRNGDAQAKASYYYDAGGREIAVVTPLDNGSYTVTRFAYDSLGHKIAELDNCTDSGTTAPATDAAIIACHGVGTANASTNVASFFAYDVHGNLVSETSPSPTSTGTLTTLYAYDSDARLCRVLQNAVNVSASAFGCTGSLPGGATATTTQNVLTSYTYDAASNLATQTVTPDSTSGKPGTTTFTYDGVGHLTSKTDPNDKTTSFTYDANGNKATETDPDTTAGGATVAWLYDGAARLCRRVAAANGASLGSTTNLSQPCSGSIWGTGIDIRYTFDQASNVASATDANTGQVVTASYDDDGRPVTVTDIGGAIGSSDPGTTYCYGTSCTNGYFTAQGSTLGRTDPSGSYTFTLDTSSRETELVNPRNTTGDKFTWTYGHAGRLISASEPVDNTTSHLVTTYAFDSLGRPTTKATTRDGSAPIATYSFVYNAAGNETSQTDFEAGGTANQTTGYAYDALGRISNFDPPTTSSILKQAYTFNAQPDRASIKVGTASPITTYFDAASRPTTDTEAKSYSSDGEGRLTGLPGQKLIYDNLGRLTEVDDQANHAITTYKYDPIDRLVSETVVATGVTTKYIYVGLSQVVAQVIAGSTTTSHVTDANGNELYEVTGTTVSYVGTNAHGDLTWAATPTAIAAGTTSSSTSYDPFGNVVASTGALPAFRWQGSLYDTATSLYYARARWYSPSLGRFTSNDPVSGTLTNPTSLDPYAYAGGDPINGSDPSGRTACYNGYCPTGGSSGGGTSTPTNIPNTSAVRSSSSSSSNGISCYDNYCHAAGGKPTPASVASDKTMAQLVQQVAIQKANSAAAVRAGCPVAYCGTDDQKQANLKADQDMEATLKAKIVENAQLAWCPVAYCGTEEQKEEDFIVDSFIDAQYKQMAAKANQHHCDNPFSCAGDLIGGVGSTVVSVVTDPKSLLMIAGCVGGTVLLSESGVGEAIGAACLAMAVQSVGEQGIDYAKDLGNHGWNPFTTAGDAWAPYAAAISAGDYYSFGAMAGSTGITWAGDALMFYGAYKGMSSPKADPAVPAQDPSAPRVEPVTCPGSFTPETTVATPNGLVPISSIRVGDQVMTYDPATGNTAPHTVTAISVKIDPAVEHLALTSGLIDTTPNHRFYTTDRGWVQAGDLGIGEPVRTESGVDAIVVSFTIDSTPTTMWDLTIDGVHTFFVGSGAALVHNCPTTAGVPDKAWNTLDHIDVTDGPPAGHSFKEFGNDGRSGTTRIPNSDGHAFVEYDVDANPVGSRNTERIVVDLTNGSVWYTPDHYFTWVRMR